jgi:hypothetical protein
MTATCSDESSLAVPVPTATRYLPSLLCCLLISRTIQFITGILLHSDFSQLIRVIIIIIIDVFVVVVVVTEGTGSE